MADNHKNVVLKRTTELEISNKQKIMDALNGKFRMVPVIMALVVIWVIFAVIDSAFLSPRNLTTLSVQIVNTGVMAIGLFLVLLHGELDLSCAATSAVSAAVAAMVCVVYEMPFIVGFLACLLTGVLIGALQGWIVTNFNAPAFIITLGSQMALEGLLLVILKNHSQISVMGTPLGMFTNVYIPDAISIAILVAAAIVLFFLFYGNHKQAVKNNLKSSMRKNVLIPVIGIALAGAIVLVIMHAYKGLNLSVLLLLALLAVFSFILTETRFGIHLYALGGNAEAVRRAGISVKKTKWAIFVISGAIFAFAGLIAASRVQSVSVSSIDQDIMMNSIAACVLGGASLTGGKGNVWGVLLGSLVMGSLSNGMYLIGAETSLRLIIQGLILAAAVILDCIIAFSSKKR